MKVILIKILSFIISIQFISAELFSQDLLNLFENHIPANILLNSNEKENVNNEFKQISKLHPDLYYFYIEYLYYKQSQNDSANYYNNWLYHCQEYSQKKNNWFKKQINFIAENQIDDVQIKHYVKQFFEELLDDNFQKSQVLEQSIPIDKNKLDYFVAKYLKNDKFLKFDPQIDYSELRKNAEKSSKEPLVNKLNIILESPLKNHDNLVKNLLQYWYIFENDSEDQINVAETLLDLFYKRTLLINILSFEDLATPFRTFILLDIYNDANRRRGISITLLDLVNIHPNLIYYFLIYLDAQYNQNEPEQAQKLYQNYINQKAKYSQKRKEWVLAQTKNIINLENTVEVQKSANEYFQSMISTRDSSIADLDQKEDVVDNNKLNFFIVQFYHRVNNLIYDKNMDYKQKRILFEKNFSQELKENYLNLFANSKLSTSNFIENYLKYWYLFDSSSMNQKHDVAISNIILDLVRKHYRFDDKSEPEKKRLPPVVLSLGMIKNNSYKHQEKIKNPEFGREWDFTTPLELSQTMISIKSRLQLRKYMTILSYLDFQFSYVYSKPIEPVKFDQRYLYSASIADDEGNTEAKLVETTTIDNGLLKFNSQKSFVFKLNVPIILITRNIKLEFGVQTGIKNVSYDFNYDCNSYLVRHTFYNDETYTSVLKNDYKNYSENAKTQNNWSVIPTLDFVIEFNRLNLSINFFKDYYSAAIGFRVF